MPTSSGGLVQSYVESLQVVESERKLLNDNCQLPRGSISPLRRLTRIDLLDLLSGGKEQVSVEKSTTTASKNTESTSRTPSLHGTPSTKAPSVYGIADESLASNGLNPGTSTAECSTTQEPANAPVSDKGVVSNSSSTNTSPVDSAETTITIAGAAEEVDTPASVTLNSHVSKLTVPVSSKGTADVVELQDQARNDELLRRCIPLPGSRNKKIWYFLPVVSQVWSPEAFSSRFTYVVHELKKAVDGHDRLRDRARFINYDLRMVGPLADTAIPSILIKCNSKDVAALQSLFNRTASRRLYCYSASSIRFKLFSDHPAPQPTFKLFYYPTNSEPTRYVAGEDICLLSSLSHSTMCGALVEYQGRYATIGLTLDIDGTDRLLTVHHLFRNDIFEKSEDVSDGGLGTLREPSGSTSSDLDGSGSWFNDSDEEDEGDMDKSGEDTLSSHASLEIDEPSETYSWLGSSAPYLDWTCLNPHSELLAATRCNYLVQGNGSHILLHNVANSPRCHATPVYLISGVLGVRTGRLLPESSYLGSLPGQDLCEVWTLVVDNDERIIPGECGSIVADQETFDIYGHLVGSDALGHGHVVPLSRTISQVRAQFNAHSVTLPNTAEPLIAHDVGKNLSVLPKRRAAGVAVTTQSEEGDHSIKQLATFVRTHETALANALPFQHRDVRNRPSQSTTVTAIPPATTSPERPSPNTSTISLVATALSLGPLKLTSLNAKSAKLALTPHKLFFLLSRFRELDIEVGRMGIRVDGLHDNSPYTNYASYQRYRQKVLSPRPYVKQMGDATGWSGFLGSLGIDAFKFTPRTKRPRDALEADLKYLYSAFTKIPCLRFAPERNENLITGYEDFPIDSAVPFYVFKNLQELEINNMNFRQIFGWDRLADQLRSLTLRRAGIEDPADILIDVVLDDMDNRRSRTSKSPSITRTGNDNSRDVPIISSGLVREASGPGSPEHSTPVAGLRQQPLSREVPVLQESNIEDNGGPSTSTPRLSSSTSHSSNLRSIEQQFKPPRSQPLQSSFSDSWHHATAKLGNPLVMGILPASKWRFLRHISLADNDMRFMPPASLAPLSDSLRSLDLSNNLFSQIPDSLACLTALRALNISHCSIDSLQSLIRNPLPAITALNLRANRLHSLAGVERLYPLERIDLRDNSLSDPMELARLTGIPDVREIWLEGNPFTKTHKDYRITIFNLFRAAPGYIEDLLIDGNGPRYFEKRLLIERARIPDPVPVIKPSHYGRVAVDGNTKSAPADKLVDDMDALRRSRLMSKDMEAAATDSVRRRRKTPKRRIVDLAPGYSLLNTLAECASEDFSPMTVSGTRKNHVSKQTEPDVGSDASASAERHLENTPISKDAAGTADGSEPPQDWNSGEVYRRKIEALRDEVGSGWLSVLSEEGWDGASNSNMHSELPSFAALRTRQVSHMHADLKRSTAGVP